MMAGILAMASDSMRRETIGHYRILDLLGTGGMGEVYLAEDTRLGRRVALKLLALDVAQDADRRRRFEREARAAAALNHPNIVTIHSVEEADGQPFLTMEIVEGHTLAGRIPPNGVAWSDFFSWSVQLVDAISAAHEQGVVHRDIKPANVMIGHNGRVKVLDFGIAKLRQPASDAAAATTASVTVAHQVIGTAAYMSPEQAEGRPVDARSDLFSLGVVLYEMATGSRPFKGDTVLSILSSIMRDTPPPVSSARPGAPGDLDRIIRRCLAKDAGRRYQTAIDLRNELEDLEAQSTTGPFTTIVAPPGAPARSIWHPTRAIGLSAGAVVLAAGAFAVWSAMSSPGAPAALRASFSQLTHQPGIEWFPSLSPDGRWVVYAGDAAGNRDIYLQSVTGQTPINLTADSPADDDQSAFSPDGEHIVFRSAREGGGLFVMGRTGEAVRRITRAGFNPSWSPDGTRIAYTTFRTELKPTNTEGVSELWVVGVDGGEPTRLSDLQTALPAWSSNGERIAFGVQRGDVARRLDIVSIPAGGGPVEPITSDEHIDWNPVWAPDGRSVYFVSDRGGSTNIWRMPIDESSGRPRGEPEPITTPAPFAAHLTVSADGSRLAYSSFLETQNLQMLTLDVTAGRAIGQPASVTMGSRFWANPDPSPDGGSVVAYSQVSPEGDLYVFRTDGSGASRQLTSDQAIDRVPRWSPDGAWIATFSDRTGSLQIWKIRPDGSDLQQVTKDGGGVAAWSPDGTRLALAVARESAEPAEGSAMIVPADQRGNAPVEWIPPGPTPDGNFVPNSWSRDGRWIAGQTWYGQLGILVYDLQARAFERLTDFGEWPVWLPDSRRILFVSRGREFHVLDARTQRTELVFSVPRDTIGPPRVTPDGRLAFFSRRVTESDIWMVNLR